LIFFLNFCNIRTNSATGRQHGVPSVGHRRGEVPKIIVTFGDGVKVSSSYLVESFADNFRTSDFDTKRDSSNFINGINKHEDNIKNIRFRLTDKRKAVFFYNM
jgi:hypothetical protein